MELRCFFVLENFYDSSKIYYKIESSYLEGVMTGWQVVSKSRVMPCPTNWIFSVISVASADPRSYKKGGCC